MQEEKLKKIQESIRKNWGKIKPFKKIPITYFNCYMFAICNTEPTEILAGIDTYISITCENVAYFGSIGQISKTYYKTIEEYKQAFINDLQVLGISAEECLENTIIPKDCIKIAFFSNFKKGMSEKDEDFHFLRFVPSINRWMGKGGFTGDFHKIGPKCPTKYTSMLNDTQQIEQCRIGIFKLSLMQK